MPVTAKLVDTTAQDGRAGGWRRRVVTGPDRASPWPPPLIQQDQKRHRHLAVWHPSTRAGPCRSGACNCKAVGEENSLGPGRAPPPAGRRRPFCLSQLTEIVVIAPSGSQPANHCRRVAAWPDRKKFSRLSPRDLLARRVNLVVIVYRLPLCSNFVPRLCCSSIAFICCQGKSV